MRFLLYILVGALVLSRIDHTKWLQSALSHSETEQKGMMIVFWAIAGALPLFVGGMIVIGLQLLLAQFGVDAFQFN